MQQIYRRTPKNALQNVVLLRNRPKLKMSSLKNLLICLKNWPARCKSIVAWLLKNTRILWKHAHHFLLFTLTRLNENTRRWSFYWGIYCRWQSKWWHWCDDNDGNDDEDLEEELLVSPVKMWSCLIG